MRGIPENLLVISSTFIRTFRWTDDQAEPDRDDLHYSSNRFLIVSMLKMNGPLTKSTPGVLQVRSLNARCLDKGPPPIVSIADFPKFFIEYRCLFPSRFRFENVTSRYKAFVKTDEFFYGISLPGFNSIRKLEKKF